MLEPITPVRSTLWLRKVELSSGFFNHKSQRTALFRTTFAGTKKKQKQKNNGTVKSANILRCPSTDVGALVAFLCLELLAFSSESVRLFFITSVPCESADNYIKHFHRLKKLIIANRHNQQQCFSSRRFPEVRPVWRRTKNGWVIINSSSFLLFPTFSPDCKWLRKRKPECIGFMNRISQPHLGNC